MTARVRNDDFGSELTGASATCSVPKPSGTIDNDGMALFWFTLTPGGAATHNTPAGWDLQGTGTSTAFGGALGSRLSIFTRVAASEGSSYTLTASGASYHAAPIVTAKNIDPADFFEAIGAQVAGNLTTIQIPAVTTTKADALLIGGCNNTAGVTFTGEDLAELVDTSSTYVGAMPAPFLGASSILEVISSAIGDCMGRAIAVNSLEHTVDVVTPHATAAYRIEATSDIAADDELGQRATAGGGAPPTGFNLLPNGAFFWDAGATLANVDIRNRDDSDSTLGAWATQIMVGGEVEQSGFRFYDDDAGESSASAAGAEDTGVTISPDVASRLRVQLDTLGETPSAEWKLQYKLSTDTTWRDLQ